MKLEGKVAVLTGGEGPLGRAMTRKFLDEGARVVVGWFAPQEWEEARALLGDYSGKFTDMQVDATNEAQVESLVKKARDSFGSVDILVHMVGQPPISARALLWETDTAVFDRMIAVNLKSAFLCCKHAVKAMLEKGKGSIVVFPAKVAIAPQSLFGAYAISKGGLITLTEALREDLKDTAITINAVMPDRIATFRTAKMPGPDADKAVKPAELADLVCSICSGECAAVSGSVLRAFGKF